MKKVIIVLGAAAFFASCTKGGVEKNPKLTTELDSASYSLGVLIGSDIGQNQDEDEKLNQKVLFSGFSAGIDGDSTAVIDRTEAMRIWRNYMEKQNDKKMKKAQEEMAKNKEAGVEFLAKNKEKAGVITTESGLQYEIVKQGEGKTPKKGDTVKVHYTGTLIDGTEFDSSRKDGREPFEVAVGEGRVIAGWDEVLQLMPVGSNWKVFIPAELAYGDRQMGTIKGGSTLIFDVEVLEIVDKK